MTVNGGGLGVFADEITVFSRVPNKGNTAPFWVAETRDLGRRLSTLVDKHQWIDGRGCPQLREVLLSIEKLPPARLAGPEAYVAFIPPSDSAATQLYAPVLDDGGNLAVSSSSKAMRADYSGPIANWWREAQKKLQPCWGNSAPTWNEGEVRSPAITGRKRQY